MASKLIHILKVISAVAALPWERGVQSLRGFSFIFRRILIIEYHLIFFQNISYEGLYTFAWVWINCRSNFATLIGVSPKNFFTVKCYCNIPYLGNMMIFEYQYQWFSEKQFILEDLYEIRFGVNYDHHWIHHTIERH